MTDVLRPLWLQTTRQSVDLDRPQSPVTPGMSRHVARQRVGSRPHVDTVEKVRDMDTGAMPRCPGTHVMRLTLRMITDAIPTRGILTDEMSVVQLVPQDVLAATTAMTTRSRQISSGGGGAARAAKPFARN